uniref:Uncharacterized protein n=1 Tax=Opuntia streptacantha TaxID=393608 RepID=A0A7C8ZL61_OPUST
MGGLNLERAFTMKRNRNLSFGLGWRAIVRHRQRQAVSTSNVVEGFKYGGIKRRRADISLAPKKKDLHITSSKGTVPLVPAVLSYSWCTQVTRGGSRAQRRCRFQMGWTESWPPRAISATAFMNCIIPVPSAIVWLNLHAKIKPPHFNIVT